MKSYPTRDKCAFIVCDDIRQEQGGKLSLMGWFPDGIVLVNIAEGPSSGPALALSTLAMAVAFLDGAGDYRARVRLVAPGGKEMLSPDNVIPVSKGEGKAMTLNFKLAPFTHDSFGQFRLSVSLDDHEYGFTFEVIRAPQVAAASTLKH